jgi:hypothetical protein
MAGNDECQTVSRAMLNLGRIGSVEGPIRSGFIGFCKANKLVSDGRELTDDVRYQLGRWMEFCERFITITELENKPSKLEKWLGQKSKNEQPFASRTETYVAVYSLFSEGDERRKWFPKMKNLCKKTKDTMGKSAGSQEIQDALIVMTELRSLAEQKLVDEKRISEKILSGRTPLR